MFTRRCLFIPTLLCAEEAAFDPNSQLLTIPLVEVRKANGANGGYVSNAIFKLALPNAIKLQSYLPTPNQFNQGVQAHFTFADGL